MKAAIGAVVLFALGLWAGRMAGGGAVPAMAWHWIPAGGGYEEGRHIGTIHTNTQSENWCAKSHTATAYTVLRDGLSAALTSATPPSGQVLWHNTINTRIYLAMTASDTPCNLLTATQREATEFRYHLFDGDASCGNPGNNCQIPLWIRSRTTTTRTTYTWTWTKPRSIFSRAAGTIQSRRGGTWPITRLVMHLD